MKKPDFIIGTVDDPYLLRWYLIPRNTWFNIYLHKIVRSDDDRALHDHPWWNLSVVLKNGYWEVMPNKGTNPADKTMHYAVWRSEGSLILRKPEAAHRLIIEKGTYTWSLFFTGPRVREWGFYCPNGWRVWNVFSTRENGIGTVSKGCDD